MGVPECVPPVSSWERFGPRLVRSHAVKILPILKVTDTTKAVATP